MARSMDEVTLLHLSMLVEDAGKLQHRIGTALRSGLGATDMSFGKTNRELLLVDLETIKVQIASVERTLSSSEPLYQPVKVARVADGT